MSTHDVTPFGDSFSFTLAQVAVSDSGAVTATLTDGKKGTGAATMAGLTRVFNGGQTVSVGLGATLAEGIKLLASPAADRLITKNPEGLLPYGLGNLLK